MKVAIITYFFAESTIALAKHLSNQDCEVHYYYLTKLKTTSTPGLNFFRAKKRFGIVKLDKESAPELLNYFENNNVQPYLIRTFSLSIFFKLANKFVALLVIRRLKKNNFDAINIVGHHELFTLFHKKLNCQNTFHSIHEINNLRIDEKNMVSPIVRFLIEKDIPIIVHSATSYRNLLEIDHIRESNIHFIPFGLFEAYKNFKKVDLLFEDRLSGNKIILFYGMIKDYKGLEVLTKATDILKLQKNDFKIIIAGSGKIPDLEQLSHKDCYIIHNRYISNEEIVALNKHADIVVCPYLSASQSGIAMTSFYLGNPIIASRVGGFNEVIKHNINGVLVNPENPKELAKALIEVLYSENRLEELKKGVKEFGKKTDDPFNWMSIATKYIQLFEKKNKSNSQKNAGNIDS